MLDSSYKETLLNPARYCAYFKGLGSVNKVVDENVILLIEIIYHIEFFGKTTCCYLKHILNVFVKKIILLVNFWSEMETNTAP